MVKNYNEASLEAFIEDQLFVNNKYIKRNSKENYNKELCVDKELFLKFLKDTQGEKWQAIQKNVSAMGNDPEDTIFHDLNNTIKKNGVIYVIQKGFDVLGVNINIVISKPANNLNPKLVANYNKNILSVIRQLYFSTKNTKSIDTVIFINGIPIITIELKNLITHQTYKDAIKQYKKDRDPKEPLLNFNRCLVHFAMDTEEVHMTTKLDNQNTYFLPFNKGLNAGKADIGILTGAGNPIIENNIKTSYLWDYILNKDTLIDIICNFVFLDKQKDQQDKSTILFPRFHQLDCVTKLVNDVVKNNVGKKYLIQHSAGSGKSNSISWLAYKLSELHYENNNAIFDSVIVVTDRRILDKQLGDNIKKFEKVKGKAQTTEHSNDLKKALENSKQIIITTLQKFPYVIEEIASLSNKKFAIIIDEAHSSQTGKTAQKMSATLSGTQAEESKNNDDKITYQDQIDRIVAHRKMQDNISYFAFTATPKNKTLELFGSSVLFDSMKKFIPFHLYSMKQAIEEKFILDVLGNYLSVETYSQIKKDIEDDPKYDIKKAKTSINKYVRNHDEVIQQKAHIIVTMFLKNLSDKINGQAKAMVCASSIKNAIAYFKKIQAILIDMDSPYKALVAFSGDHDKQSEHSLNNGISGNNISVEFNKEEYKFLIVADKFQTGFDQPLLHSMFIDKPLKDVGAVQTLSRINRTAKGKNNTLIFDFLNQEESITKAFEQYYEVTTLENPTDIQQLYDLKTQLDSASVYSKEDIKEFVKLHLNQALEDIIHGKLDIIVRLFTTLDQEDQKIFYNNAKSFIKNYQFIAQILPKEYDSSSLEEVYILLSYLVQKLAPLFKNMAGESIDILNNIVLEKFKLSTNEVKSISLSQNGEISPISANKSITAEQQTPEEENLDTIVTDYNQQHQSDLWTDEEKISQMTIDNLVKNEDNIKAVKTVDEPTAKEVMKKSINPIIAKIMATTPGLATSSLPNEETIQEIIDKAYIQIKKEYNMG